MHPPSSLARIAAMLLAGLVLLAGCSSDSGDATTEPVSGGGWVTITTPTTASSHTEACNEVYLAGEAFISPEWSRCCSGSAEDTGVTVSWNNLATGGSGQASQQVRICYFLGTPYLCDHTWYARIPLALGGNTIRVTAADPGGRAGSKNIDVLHPMQTYSIAGTVTTTDGAALPNRESQITLSLAGDESLRSTWTAFDGSYRFSCLPGGSYLITPSSPIAYMFAPSARQLTIVAEDVSGEDFHTEAWFLSGRVVQGASGTGLWVQVSVSGAETAVSQWTEWFSGAYRFALPNGSYTVRAAGSELAVVIDGEDLDGQDLIVW